jgi:hypothetical protein
MQQITQQIVENLKQSLLDQHVPSEQIQNIINSVDLSQINLQDLSSITDYLGNFLANMGLQEGVINAINGNLADNFGNFGIDNISDLGLNEDGFLGTVKNILGSFFGRE